jgi:transcriptional regulator with XRE-family HTH domain
MVQNHGGMQMEPMYLSIQPVETGKRIKQLLSEQNYTIREIQGAFGFENPQAIYKWIAGKSLPSLDNFIILSRLLHTSIENILVIDGDIPRLWASLNHWFNDFFSLPPYNHIIRN